MMKVVPGVAAVPVVVLLSAVLAVAASAKPPLVADAASARGAEALERGGPVADDPQAGLGAVMALPPVKGVSVVKDGQTLRVGPLAVTTHLTPGHTPGSTTWTWRSCEGTRCLDV